MKKCLFVVLTVLLSINLDAQDIQKFSVAKDNIVSSVVIDIANLSN